MDLVRIAEKLSKQTPAKLLFKVLSRDDVKAFIINLNTVDQLDNKHVNALGVELYTIGGEYTINTQLIKNVGARDISLNQTGKYHKTFAVIPLNTGDFTIISDNTIYGDRTFLAKERWGVLEGITKENLQKVNIFLSRKLVEELTNF